MQKKVIIDCDPGYDDALALFLAARSPEISLIGVTCVAGNAEVEKTAYNALCLCSLAGMPQIPVAKGMAHPLYNRLETAPHIHGESGLGGVDLPNPDGTLHPQHAVDFLIDTIMASDDDITVIPIGPLTNIAMALLKEPRLALHIPEIVLMGGSMGLGNATPSAEFNIYADPEAAKVVFNAGIPIVMVGLDVTHQALLTPQHIMAIAKNGTPVAAVAATILRAYREKITPLGEECVMTMHDACAVATVCDPTLLTARLMRVDIETRGEYTRGRTVCAPGFIIEKPLNVRVGTAFNAERFYAMLIDRLQ